MTLVDNATQQLLNAGIESARLDSFVLIEHVSKKSREWLLTHPEFELTRSQQNELDRLLQKRITHMPVAYLIGHKEFYGLTFKINSNTLIPRPETEALVEYAIQNAPPSARVLEIGTGSGCIAVSLAFHRNDLHIDATDISKSALEIARTNNELHKTNVSFYESDLFEQVDGKYDVILANLPYVPVNQEHQAEIKHEPKSALFSGEDGLAHYRKCIPQLTNYLSKDGFALIECNPDQAKPIKDLCNKNRLTLSEITRFIYLLEIR